jgi:hypothetical protein
MYNSIVIVIVIDSFHNADVASQLIRFEYQFSYNGVYIFTIIGHIFHTFSQAYHLKLA